MRVTVRATVRVTVRATVRATVRVTVRATVRVTVRATVRVIDMGADPLLLSGAQVSARVVRGQELRELGYGGIWGVGKAALEAPALVVLSYHPTPAAAQAAAPATATATGSGDAQRGESSDMGGGAVVMVGKGIVYDTGGLSLKVGGGMVGMKSDMGGAAAVLAAFEAAVQVLTCWEGGGGDEGVKSLR
jgi:probable aminopeptidase NPEPL1